MIWEVAGILGVDPRPFTVRQLDLMSRGKMKEAWNHTAALLALIETVNRGDGKVSKPERWHPFTEKRKKNPITPRELAAAIMGAQ